MQGLRINSFPTRWVIEQDVWASRNASTPYLTLIRCGRINFLEAIKKALARRNIAGKRTTIDIVRAGPKIENFGQRPKTVVPVPRFGQPVVSETFKESVKRIKRELIESGMTAYGLLKPESRILPKILHANENIMAVIYGRQQSSSIMVVATDKRIISLDKKPMVLLMDEFSYEVIAGLEFEIHTLFATLVLHTPVKKYDLRFVNLRCADSFVRYVETQRIKSIRKKDDKASREERSVIDNPLVLYPRHATNFEIAQRKEIEKESEDETYYSLLNE